MQRSDFILFSGGAPGAEAEFGANAERLGIEEVNFTFEGHSHVRQRGLRFLNHEELLTGDVSLEYVSKLLNRRYTDSPDDPEGAPEHLVSRSTAARKSTSSARSSTTAPSRAAPGWGAEFAKLCNKPLFVFDQEQERLVRLVGPRLAGCAPAPTCRSSATRTSRAPARASSNENGRARHRRACSSARSRSGRRRQWRRRVTGRTPGAAVASLPSCTAGSRWPASLSPISTRVAPKYSRQRSAHPARGVGVARHFLRIPRLHARVDHDGRRAHDVIAPQRPRAPRRCRTPGSKRVNVVHRKFIALRHRPPRLVRHHDQRPVGKRRVRGDARGRVAVVGERRRVDDEAAGAEHAHVGRPLRQARGRERPRQRPHRDRRSPARRPSIPR